MSKISLIESLKALLYRSSQVAGVEYVQTKDGFAWHVVIMERQQKKAIFTKTTSISGAASQDSWKALKEFVGKDCPIFLSINSPAVIHKKTTVLGGSDNNALQQIFPNAVADDFYIQRILSNDNEFISIARRDTIDNLLALAKKEGLPIIHLSLGPFPVSSILPLLKPQDNLVLDSHILLLNNQEIVDFSPNSSAIQETQQVGESDSLDNCHLVAAALALSGLSDLSTEGIPSVLIEEEQSEFFYKKLFQSLGMGLLALFFIALLASYLLFSNYQTTNTKLEVQLQRNAFLIGQRDTLRAQYARQSAFFGPNKSSNLSKLSFYADQLASSLPSTIQFTELQIFPEIIDKNRSSTDNSLRKYEVDIIRIKGTCKGSVFYNNWKKGVQELSWVKELHNLHYQDLDEDTGAFELEIRVK